MRELNATAQGLARYIIEPTNLQGPEKSNSGSPTLGLIAPTPKIYASAEDR
jgi:hypothetical protein